MSTVQKYPANMTTEAFEAAMKELVFRARKEGRVSLADLDALLAKTTLTSEEIEKVHDCFTEMGIALIPEQTGPSAQKEDAGTSRELLMDAMKEILDTLTEREAAVIRMRFGLDDGFTHTLEEVAQAFGVTRERIRMVENKAIRRHRRNHYRKRIRDFYQ